MYPILFEFGSVSIYALWFFVSIGFIVGSLTFTQFCKRNRVNFELFTHHSFKLFAISLIFGRLTFVALHSELFLNDYSLNEFFGILGIWDKGLSFWGSLGGLIAGIYLLRNKTDESISAIFDNLTPAVLVAMAFGSFGSFLDGSFYGTPTDLPWGVTFRSAYVKYISNIHPTQLYSLIYELMIMIIVIKIMNSLRGTSVKGFAAEIGFTLISFFVFIEEFMRGDDVFRILNIRLPQILSAICFIIGLRLFYRRFKNPSQYDPGGDLKKLFFPITSILKKMRLMRLNPLIQVSDHSSELSQ